MKLSIANGEPKAPKEKEYEFSLSSVGNSVKLQATVNGGPKFTLFSLQTDTFRVEKVHVVRQCLTPENAPHFTVDGLKQISY